MARNCRMQVTYSQLYRFGRITRMDVSTRNAATCLLADTPLVVIVGEWTGVVFRYRRKTETCKAGKFSENMWRRICEREREREKEGIELEREVGFVARVSQGRHRISREAGHEWTRLPQLRRWQPGIGIASASLDSQPAIQPTIRRGSSRSRSNGAKLELCSAPVRPFRCYVSQ